MSLALLEKELSWREAEIARLKIFISLPEESPSRDTLLKCLVMLCYAHFEGIIKFSLGILIDEVNAGGYAIKELHDNCAASALDSFISKIKNSMNHSSICEILLQKNTDHLDEVVRLSESNSDRNMWPDEIEKIFGEIGINLPALDHHRTTISTLINIRNDLAHGKNKRVKSFSDYQKYEAATRNVSLAVVIAVHESIANKAYLVQSRKQESAS